MLPQIDQSLFDAEGYRVAFVCFRNTFSKQFLLLILSSQFKKKVSDNLTAQAEL
jgi:hypothetical protein